jgi:hypothetical protein
VDDGLVTGADLFEDSLYGVFGIGVCEVRVSAVATESDEVKVARVVDARQAAGHGAG